MIEVLPNYVQFTFLFATVLTAWFLFKATQSALIISIVFVWMILQFILTWNGFYADTGIIPPHSMLLVAPWILLIILLFTLKKGRKLIDGFDEKWLTYLHVVRIPVEITLIYLSMYKLVPVSMTFEGRNFDIYSGITAPFIAYYGYQNRKLIKEVMIAWNILCLILVLNVAITGILSIPTPFQKLSFDQPNIGVLYFPFIYLPCFIVPVVILSHLICLRKLLKT